MKKIIFQSAMQALLPSIGVAFLIPWLDGKPMPNFAAMAWLFTVTFLTFVAYEWYFSTRPQASPPGKSADQ
jgi:hypothetical protein